MMSLPLIQAGVKFNFHPRKQPISVQKYQLIYNL
jgi:hypothetical protein